MRNKIYNYIGIAIIASLFLGVGVWGYILMGLTRVILAFVITAISVGLVFAGVYLMTYEPENE